MGAVAGFGQARPKREPIEVIEPRPRDKSLDKLLGVRKQRLGRFERERKEAQERWRHARARLHEEKLAWREATQATRDFWTQARHEFLTMNTTSGQYQRAKATYERMKEHCANLRMGCLEAVEKCRNARSGFFEARERVLTANRQQEKLTFMRDELRAQHEQSEAST